MTDPLSRLQAVTDAGLVTTGKALALLSLSLSGVLVARVCGPSEFGLYAAGLTLALLVDAIVGSPLDLAVVRAGAIFVGERERVDRIQAAALRIKLVIVLALLAAGVIARRPLSALLFASESRYTLLLVALLSAVALLLIRGTAAQLQIDLHFRTYAILDGVQGALRLLGVGLLIVAGVGAAEAYLGAHGLAAAAAFGLSLWGLRQRYLAAPWPDAADARAIMSYAATTAAVVVLGTITGRTDVLLLSIGHEPATAGHYAAAVQIAMLGSMLAMYANIAFQPRIIPLVRQGQLGGLLRGNLLVAGLLAVVAIPAARFVFPPLMALVFGADFAPALPILQILIVGTCADYFCVPVAYSFGLQLYPRTALAGEAVITAAYLLCIPVVVPHGAIALAWTVSATRVARMAWYLGIALRNRGRAAAREDQR